MLAKIMWEKSVKIRVLKFKRKQEYFLKCKNTQKRTPLQMFSFYGGERTLPLICIIILKIIY